MHHGIFPVNPFANVLRSAAEVDRIRAEVERVRRQQVPSDRDKHHPTISLTVEDYREVTIDEDAGTTKTAAADATALEPNRPKYRGT